MRRRYGLSGMELKQLRAVVIESALRQQLGTHAGAAGYEICAALYGYVENSSLVVTGWRRLTNRDPSGCFMVSVNELLHPAPSGVKSRLVGLFHSHLQGLAQPSDLDCSSIARLPFVWTITSVAGDELRAFTWSKAGVRELSVQRSSRSTEGPHNVSAILVDSEPSIRQGG